MTEITFSLCLPSFSLQSLCLPVSGLDSSWLTNGRQTTYLYSKVLVVTLRDVIVVVLLVLVLINFQLFYSGSHLKAYAYNDATTFTTKDGKRAAPASTPYRSASPTKGVCLQTK
jgi:hypothetical protein